jgi:nucleoside-diphosphate-sugar epimerase
VLLPRLRLLVERGQFAWIGGGRALTSSCHVKNVSAGLLATLERGAPGEAYFVTDGPPISFREYIGGMLAAVGCDASRAPSVPLAVARPLARVMEAWWCLARKSGEPPLTRTTVELIGAEVTVKDDKARRELGYAPVITREEGLSELRAASAGPGGSRAPQAGAAG